MRDSRATKVVVLSVILIMLFSIFIMTQFTGASNDSGNAVLWRPGTFEDNMVLSYQPTMPAPKQAVNITIISKETPINNASINLNWYAPSGDHSFGSYFMTPQNANLTIYMGRIPGTINLYPGIKVVFNVKAYDTTNTALTSINYTYNVTNAGGWKYTNFSDNVALSYTPAQPQPFGIVNISIQGKVPNVPFKYVQYNIMYQPPGQDYAGPYSLSFKNVSSTSFYALVGTDPRNTPNQPGYNVTFWVDVYDMWGVKIESSHINYKINQSSVNPNPQKYSFFTIVVYDDINLKYLSGASIEIKNKSKTITGESNQFGWYIPVNNKTNTVIWLLIGDTYTVTVKYKGAVASIDYVLTLDATTNKTLTDMKDYKIQLNKGTLEFHFKITELLNFEEFPQWYLYPIYIGAIIVPLAVAWYLYYKQEEERKRLIKEKKKLGYQPKEKKGIGPFLWDIFDKETKKPNIVKPIGFFVLGIAGTVFAPFYPWWMILLLSAITAILAYKYPYLSLIVLSLFVTASAGYQSPEFGLVFLMFTLFILLVGFFDWKFGYLTMLAVFVGRFGLPFLVPIFATILYSTFLGIAVAAASLTFLTFIVTCGNVTIIGFFTGVNHYNAIATFASPIKSNFVPGDMASAFSGIGNADTDFINTIISNNFGSSILPYFLIFVWCFAFYLIGHLVEKKGISFSTLKSWMEHPLKKKQPRYFITGAIAVIFVSSIGSMLLQDMFTGMSIFQGIGTIILLACGVVIVYTAVVATMITREVFAEWYTAQIGISAIGTRISEMQSLGKTTFEMVGGLNDVKQDLKESMIVPLLRPDISEQFGIEPAKGIMLFGPPGCGKTLLMKALATELHVEMINIKCSDIMSKWYGESEGRITELFKTAKERKPCIIFFDEIDAIAKKRELYSADDVTPRLLSIMLSELDGMDRSAGIIMVGSTNKPEMCDTALMRPGRFDKIMYVPPPAYEERIDIFKVHLQGKPIADDINLHELAKRTERFSGADIANLVKEAATMGMRRAMDSGKFTLITMEDFMGLLPRMRPSISLSQKEEYEKIKQRYERKMHDLYRTEKRLSINWEDIANLVEIKKELHDFIELPLKRSDLVDQYKLRTGKGLLLYGPQGCGKTFVMKAAANKFNIPMQVVNTAELVNSLVSEGENAMKEIFVRAKDTAPSIVLFVELEMLLFKTDVEEGNAGMREMFVQNQLISVFDKLNPADKVIIVATTDKPDMISGEFFKPGRLDKTIYIPPPDKEMRKEMFELYLKDVPKQSEMDYDLLAEKTDMFSGDDISNVVNESKLLSIKDNFYTGEEKLEDYGVKMEELLKAIEKTQPSVNPDIVAKCEKFSESMKR